MVEREAPRPRIPAVVPSLLIALGGRVLPGGSARERYRQEFTAELYGMTPRRQTAHALQIVVSSWALRSATRHPREGKTMVNILRRKPLLCLLNVRHDWETQSSPDGERYQRCSRCGKDRMEYPWGLDPKGRNTIGG
jgi:hypothetical protein